MSTFGTGFASAIPFFCGFVGSLVAGWLSDLMTQRSTSPVRGRKTPLVAAMLGMALFAVPAALVHWSRAMWWLACISVVLFLANAASACSWGAGHGRGTAQPGGLTRRDRVVRNCGHRIDRDAPD
jgi:MFS family permease